MSSTHGLMRKAHFLGTKIRRLRKRNNLTLEDLSVQIHDIGRVIKGSDQRFQRSVLVGSICKWVPVKPLDFQPQIFCKIESIVDRQREFLLTNGFRGPLEVRKAVLMRLLMCANQEMSKLPACGACLRQQFWNGGL